MPRKAIGMALCALLILSACSGDKKTVIDITAPSPTFSATLIVKATAEAYASCNAGSSRATAYATATAEVTVYGTGSTQEAADADAKAKYDAAYADKVKEAKATAEAKAVAICETGGTPIPGPGPGPKAQCDDGIDNDGDGKVDYPTDPGCSSREDDDERDAPIPPTPQCRNGIDDDGDGKIDFNPPPGRTADPGCSSSDDDDERDTPAADPICTLTAVPSSVPQGTPSTLTWGSAGGTVRNDKDWTDNTSLNGSSQVVINETRIFRVTCYNRDGKSMTVSATVTVTGPACPATNDYTPAGGSIAVGQSITLTATDPRCDPFWGVDKPSLGSIVGSDKVVVIDGKQYPVGQRAVVKRIAPGTFQGFIQPSVVNPTKTWHTWTNPTSLVETELGEPGRAAIMFEVRSDGTVWYNGRPVEQTGPPKK